MPLMRFWTVLLACLFLYADLLHAKKVSWDYINLSDSDQTFSIFSQPSSIALRDFGVEATECSSEDTYICLISKGLVFAVPKKTLKMSSKWEFENESFEIVSVREIEIFGLLEKIYFIQSTQAEVKLSFLFSNIRGLIGFGGLAPGSNKLFLLDGRCGFGAPQDCSL